MTTNQTEEAKPSPLTFPCDFPIKIVGKAEAAFETDVLAIFKKHLPQLPESSLKQRISAQGKYLALTVTIHAESQKQIDDLYRDLSQCPEVIMAL